MTTYEWCDITSEIVQASKSLRLFETVAIQTFNLESSMQASQINDPKIDAKSDFGKHCTLQYLISNKMVKHPTEVTLQQLAGILDDVLGHQLLCLKGQPLAQSIYTFPYLYDKQVCKDNSYLLALVESINTFGSYASEIIKAGCSTKQDDITYNTFGFSTAKKSHQEIMDLLLKQEKKLDQERTKSNISSKVLNIYDALIARFKFRRFMHNLAKILALKFEPKNADKILKQIDTCRKRLEDYHKYAHYYTPTTNIFNTDIFKALRTHISPRTILQPKLQTTLTELDNMFAQLELFIPLPKQYSEIVQRMDILSRLPINILSKSYIISNFFCKQEHLWSHQLTTEVVINDIVDWVGIKEITTKNQLFLNFIKTSTPVMSQILYRMLANRYRWYWEASKIYEDYNIIVHYANELDSKLVENKSQLFICSWVYYVAINNMIKQLHIGIESELYYPTEYPCIFYYLDYLLNIADKNANTFIKRLDKVYVTSFYQKNLDNKKKKKVNQNSRKMFSLVVFNKGLLFYYRALYKLFFVLVKNGVLKQTTNKQNFSGRFKIFKKVLFTKGVDYDSFFKDFEADTAPQNQKNTLQVAEDNLKEAKNIFQSLQIFDVGTEISQVTKKHSLHLTTLCVKLSLQVMKFKMNRGMCKQVKFIRNNPMFPQFTF